MMGNPSDHALCSWLRGASVQYPAEFRIDRLVGSLYRPYAKTAALVKFVDDPAA
jgi:hypothetical protein